MTLYLLRHAIAAERGSHEYPDDSLRPLTPKGERRMQRIAEGMLRLGLSFDLLLSSPYRRAKQTADVVAEVFKAQERLHVTPMLAPDGDPRRLIAEVRGRSTAQQHVLLVGHEPYLSNLIARLVSSSPDLRVVMKKGGLCQLGVSTLRFGQCATLDWLMTPRQLRLLA
jgi:phosphohistidine phosphatase